MTGADLARIEQLPDTGRAEADEVVDPGRATWSATARRSSRRSA